MVKMLLMTLRLLWVIALVTGALFYFRVGGLPVNIHMYLGFAIALIMIVIGLFGFRASVGLALGNIVVAILLPVIGILQLKHVGMPDLPYIQITHVIVGIGAIGIAEVLGKRIRLSQAR